MDSATRRRGGNRQLFPNVQIRDDESGAQQWATRQDGGIQAVGVNTGIAGFGADLLIVDDPFKDRKEAESPVARQNVWEWFTSAALQRLSPDGIVVIIMTRWHVDDLVGRLTNPKYTAELADAGFHDETYRVFNLPATCRDDVNDFLCRKQGEALWPERWTERILAAKKIAAGSYEYSAQFDGDPRPRGANTGITDKIQWIESKDVPKDLEQVRTWDLAVTNTESSDWNASARGGYHRTTDTFYITHIYRRISRWLGTKAAVKDFGDRELGRIIIEAIGGFDGLFDEVRLMQSGKNVVQASKPSTSKESRAWPWLAHMEAGKVIIVRGEWNTDLLDEINVFPMGTHDDQVDAVSALWEFTKNRKPLLYA